MELHNLTIHEAGELLKKKTISVVELVKSTLNRIDEVEPKIGSYISVYRNEAIKKADEIQARYDRGELSSPLLGIPMALKDNICTKNIKTTCASKMLENFVPPYDATVASRLYDAGTILVGKTNMDEFAMGSSTEKSYFKKTSNPWDTDRVPGGSSGGSSAAVAAGEAFFSIASDTGGSIRQPAGFCGVVGMKPTYGTISRYGLVASASSLDTVGTMTKDVTDLALVMNCIAGYDEMDSTSANIKHPDFTKSLINDVKGLKIGVPKEYMGEGIEPDVRKAILDALETLEKLGAQYEEISLPMAEYALPVYYVISACEASSNLARFDGIKYGYCTDKFSDLNDMYRKTRSEGFGAEVKRRIILGTHLLGGECYEKYYVKAMQARTLIMQDFERAFEKYDLLVTPISPNTAFKLGEKFENPLEMYLTDLCTVCVNIAGKPALTVPCGFDTKGLPIGIQFVGRDFAENTLIQTAYTFEQNTEFHKKRPKL